MSKGRGSSYATWQSYVDFVMGIDAVLLSSSLHSSIVFGPMKEKWPLLQKSLQCEIIGQSEWQYITFHTIVNNCWPRISLPANIGFQSLGNCSLEIQPFQWYRFWPIPIHQRIPNLTWINLAEVHLMSCQKPLEPRRVWNRHHHLMFNLVYLISTLSFGII